MSFWKWSKTPANNGTADPSCPFPEGMAPSAVNDGTRGMMAALAKYRDDISGMLVTGGTGSTYTIASNQAFDNAAHLDGAMIAFVPHVNSDAAPNLNVDGIGAKPLRGQSGTDLLPGALQAGTPYVAFFSNSNSEFVLHSYFVSGEIPIGSGCDYWGSVVPNDNFAFPYGQAISRTGNPVCFTRLGTTYGSGDGSTTFNLPDKRGRVSAANDNLGGTTAGRLNSLSGMLPDGNSNGAVGGAQAVALTGDNNGPHAHGNFLTDNGHAHNFNGPPDFPITNFQPGGASVRLPGGNTSTQTTSSNLTGITLTNATSGSGVAHINVQPTIVCPYIIRIR